MFLGVDYPGHFGRIEAVFVDKDAARPDASRHRIGTHADLLAFEILGHADAGVWPNDKTTVMKSAHYEDRQCDVRCAACARDHVGSRRHLADVELNAPNHPAERLDDRHDFDEIRVHFLYWNDDLFDRQRGAVSADRDRKPRPGSTGWSSAASSM